MLAHLSMREIAGRLGRLFSLGQFIITVANWAAHLADDLGYLRSDNPTCVRKLLLDLLVVLTTGVDTPPPRHHGRSGTLAHLRSRDALRAVDFITASPWYPVIGSEPFPNDVSFSSNKKPRQGGAN